jgi:cell division protein FtsQ
MSYLLTGRPLSILLCGVALWYGVSLLQNPAYVVKTVTVTGASTLSAARVSELTGAIGQPVWALDAAAIAATIRQSPYVVSADVAINLPNTVTVTMNERASEVRWKNGSLYLIIDDSGEILGIDPAVVITGTLIINDDSAVLLQPGDRVAADIIPMARSVAQRFPAEVKLDIARLGWDERRGISVITADNRTILLGTSARIDEKLAILAQLVSEQSAFAFADVRSMTPYYRDDIPFTETITQTLVLSDTVTPQP